MALPPSSLFFIVLVLSTHHGTTRGQCSDQHISCRYWSSIGECQKNPRYMLQGCKKSCNVCSDCPSGWSAHGFYCYKLFHETKTWKDAEDDCSTNHLGHLASVHSEAENNFISNLWSADGVWLGATDFVNEGTWAWTDGTAFKYNKWRPGEPNSHGGNEDCIETNLWGPRWWNDKNCNAELRYVCKRPAF